MADEIDLRRTLDAYRARRGQLRPPEGLWWADDMGALTAACTRSASRATGSGWPVSTTRST
jgi:hypothetical protein